MTISAAPLPTTIGGSGFQDALGLPALMMAGPYCRLSGIALDATNIGNYFLSTSGQTTANSTTVSGITTLTSGGQVVVPGMPIIGANIPNGASVVSITTGTCPCTIQISQAATSTTSEPIAFTGFYTLDVAGTHVGIDSRSVLQGGYDNVYCADSQLDGLQVNDAQIQKAWHDGVHITSACDNIRLIADIFDSNGKDGSGAGVWFSGLDLTLANGIAEQSGGQGLFITGADQADVTGMVFNANSAGVTSGQAPNVQIDNSADISFCGNRIQGSASDTASTSAVLFSGVDDNITLCGNAYTARNAGNDTNVLPLFDYDVSTTPTPPTITNTHIYETAARPAVSVFTPAAQPLLQPLQVPQFSQSEFSGLTLSNGGTSLQVNVAPGAAADSTNSTIISLPSSCTVDLTKSGAGGLDTGSAVRGTTYFIFAIAPAATNPGFPVPAAGCMASTSPTPAFTASNFTGTGYQVVPNSAGTHAGDTTIYNVNPLAGVSVGDAIMSTDTSLAPTTISGFSANTSPGATTGNLSSGSPNISMVSTSGTIQVGMAIQDTTKNCIPANAYVISVALPLLTMSKNAQCSGTGDALSISGALQLTVSASAAVTEAPAPLIISTGYYRMVGAVFTTSASLPTLVQFIQDNDTFYLDVPTADVSNVTLGGTNILGPLSVPNNIVTEAFGRCVATGGTMTNYIELYTPSTAPGSGANFPTVPGYALKTVASSASVDGVSFPYRLHTDTAQHIDAAATIGSPVLNCMTDGWVWKRAQ